MTEPERQGRGLVTVRASERLKSDGSAMSWTGNRLRVDLTKGEIEFVKSRIRELLARPDLSQRTRAR